MRASACFCLFVCGIGRHCPFETMCVGSGDGKSPPPGWYARAHFARSSSLRSVRSGSQYPSVSFHLGASLMSLFLLLLLPPTGSSTPSTSPFPPPFRGARSPTRSRFATRLAAPAAHIAALDPPVPTAVSDDRR